VLHIDLLIAPMTLVRLPLAKIISLREANQAFSRCIREVEAGAEYVITRNGEPVARLAPIAGHRILSREQSAARARARARMEKGWPIAAGPLDRDELHER
jgi:prevent-host-death family protein